MNKTKYNSPMQCFTNQNNTSIDEVIPMDIDDVKDNKIVTRKKYIPKALREISWDIVYGRDIGQALCKVCNIRFISQLNFDCGHILSEANGGLTNIHNLIPLCKQCNSSMGRKHLLAYVDEFHPNNTNIKLCIDKIINFQKITKLN